MEVNINSSNFEKEVIEYKGTVIVDFYGSWCMPCKMVSPIVDEISNEVENVIVGKINVDEEAELAQAFGIESIPTLVVINDGKILNHAIGVRSKENILEMFN